MITETNISIEKVNESRLPSVDLDNLPFGRVFTDHMFVMQYKDGEWLKPSIKPFQNFSMHPAMSAIHYGQSIFEGMKAYKNAEGEVLLFRPHQNITRMNQSADRMCMPAIPEDLFYNGLTELIKLDKDWIPGKEGSSLYIRPYMFATDEYIGIKPSDAYTFAIFCCPVGAYYSEPLKVKIETKYTRAAEGGIGQAKAAGNYAAALYPAKMAKAHGYHQLVWTDAKEHKYIEESGTMNIIFEIDGKLITPSGSGTILRGITRRSVVDVARHWGIQVEERTVTVEEVVDALENGTLTDAFGAGTAATIAQVKTIGYNGKDYELPAVSERGFSNKVFSYLNDLKRGEVDDPFSWVVKA